MISSDQVSAMIAEQQQQMAMAFQPRAGTIGGIGSYGYMNRPMMPPMITPLPARPTAIPYNGPMDSGFSYDQQTGYGLSNQAGNMAMGGIRSSAGLASVGLNLAGMYGGYRAARAMGSGVLGAGFSGAMAFGPASIAAMGVEHIAGNMHSGMKEQQAIYGTLGQNFNFINQSSRSGRGFSRQDAKSISDFAREMQSVPQMMTSMSELTRIMNTISQMGVMSGAKTAQEFNRRFKENINTLKEISKVMQSTMEEAIGYMNDAKQAGFHTKAGQILNTAQRQFTSGITGMNQQQLQQLQMSGSAMSFGTGGYRRSGSNLALRTARQIGIANDMGVFNTEAGNAMEELTGLQGADAIGAMSEMMTGAAYRMSQSSLGTAMSIAVAQQDKSGRFTGIVDQEMVDRIRNRGISKEEILSLARSKTRGRNSKISWGRQKDKLRSEMASSVGAEGMMMELEEILGERGWNNPDVTNIVMQRYGVDEKTAEAVQLMGKNLGNIQGEIGKQGQVESRRQKEQAQLAGLSGDALKRKFEKKLENALEEPFRKLGANMSHAVESYVDDFMDSLMDRYSVEIDKNTASIVSGALSGDKKSAEALSNMKGYATSSTGPSVSHSRLMDKMKAFATDEKSAELERYNFLSDLGGKYASYTSDGGITQSSEQESLTRGMLRDLGRGEISGDIGKILGASEGIMTGEIEHFLKENNAKMRGMSQVERMNYLKENISGLTAFSESGATAEEIVAYAQKKGGMSNYLGAVNFNKYADERYDGSNRTFETTKQLATAQKQSGEAFAKSFENSSAVSAILQKDTSDRSLLLAASSGDKDAHRLLTEELPPAERDKLLKKYGVSESQVESLVDVYSGRGKDSAGLAQTHMRDISRSSMAAEASQLRRQGLDIKDRWKQSSLGVGGVSTQLIEFSDALSGLDSSQKMIDLLGSGGKMGGQIRSVLDAVRGLKGKEKDEALKVLGPGARGALDIESSIFKKARSKSGLEAIASEGGDDIKDFIEKHINKKGVLSDEDRRELAKKMGDRSFASSIAQSGLVMGKDMPGQTSLTSELTKFVDANTRFAQVVFENVPQLKGAAGVQQQVQGAGQQVKQAPKPTYANSK